MLKHLKDDKKSYEAANSNLILRGELTKEFYDNHHIAITQTSYLKLKDKGHYSDYKYTSRNGALSIEEINPTPQNLSSLITAFGRFWGWDIRPKYNGIESAKELIEGNGNPRLFLLKTSKVEQDSHGIIGFCFAHEQAKPLNAIFKNNSGADRVEEYTNKFAPERDINFSIMQIEHVALFPTLNGQGYGRFYLGQFFEEYFNNEGNNYDLLYLQSRGGGQNHKKVPKFYTKYMGMTMLRTEFNIPNEIRETALKLENDELRTLLNSIDREGSKMIPNRNLYIPAPSLKKVS